MQSDSYLDSEEQERELRADVHIECCGKPPRGATASPYGTPPSAACHEFQVESTQTEHGIGAKRLQMALKGFWGGSTQEWSLSTQPPSPRGGTFPTDGRPMADRRPTDGRPTADRRRDHIDFLPLRAIKFLGHTLDFLALICIFSQLRNVPKYSALASHPGP